MKKTLLLAAVLAASTSAVLAEKLVIKGSDTLGAKLVPFDVPPRPVVPPAVTPILPPELLVPLVVLLQAVPQSATAMTQRNGRRTIEPAKQILVRLLRIFIVGNLARVAV